MEEVLKALGPWPLAQGIVIGLLVAAAGIWAMRRGMQESRRRENADGAAQLVKIDRTEEERRLDWKFVEQMERIDKNAAEVPMLLEKILEAVNRFNDTRWNKGQ